MVSGHRVIVANSSGRTCGRQRHADAGGVRRLVIHPACGVPLALPISPSPLQQGSRRRLSGPLRPGTADPRPGGAGTRGTTIEPRPATTSRTRTPRPTAGSSSAGRQAGPRPEGDADRLRQEEGPAYEDRRMDPPAGRGGLPVRPRPAAIYDPLTEPCPPTPRADAYAGSAWAWCKARHLNRWTAGQRRKFEAI